LIEPFARYGFNKSHAVAYALVAYKTAYLKAHYPVDFFGANLSSEIGSTDGIVKVLGDCQESGIAVLPPDINESAESFAAFGGSIRFGLAAIKGVGEAAARAIIDERGKRPFASFTDFAERLDSRLVNKRTLDALIAAGAFDSLGRNRATLAAASERVVARAARRRDDEASGQASMFGGGPADEEGPPRDDFQDAPSGRSTSGCAARRRRSASTSRAIRSRASRTRSTASPTCVSPTSAAASSSPSGSPACSAA
jgi:DNA polymerase-3 subunit alpha